MSARLRRGDAGFSLVELIVAMGLFGIVITIVGSVIISAITADRTVRNVTGSTTDGQLVVNIIEETVRNSTAVFVVTAADGVSTFATARTTAGGSARCQSWFYDDQEGAVFERSSATAVAAPNPGAVGTEWTLVSQGLAPVEDGAGTPVAVFALDGTRGLSVNFTVDGGSGTSSLFITTVTGRAPQSNVSPQCF